MKKKLKKHEKKMIWDVINTYLLEGFSKPYQSDKEMHDDILKKSEFETIVEEMSEIHRAKNSDYAGEDYLSNLRACERLGIPAWKGVLVRIGDKISRLENFAKKESLEVKDESIEDTLKDLANYAILCLITYRNMR